MPNRFAASLHLDVMMAALRRGLFAVDGRANFAWERKPRLGAVALVPCPCRLRGV